VEDEPSAELGAAVGTVVVADVLADRASGAFATSTWSSR